MLSDFNAFERFDASRGPMGASALRFITNQAEASGEAKELQIYCQKLVEEHEDALTAMLAGTSGPNLATMCKTEAKLCSDEQLDEFSAKKGSWCVTTYDTEECFDKCHAFLSESLDATYIVVCAGNTLSGVRPNQIENDGKL